MSAQSGHPPSSVRTQPWHSNWKSCFVSTACCLTKAFSQEVLGIARIAWSRRSMPNHSGNSINPHGNGFFNSPDGSHLAILGANSVANVWMIDNF
jgi:hypothetical protein